MAIKFSTHLSSAISKLLRYINLQKNTSSIFTKFVQIFIDAKHRNKPSSKKQKDFYRSRYQKTNTLKTWNLSISGIVQGVGFRPTILNYCKELKLKIEISNTNFGVEILYNATDKNKAEILAENILKHIPPKAKIDLFFVNEVEYREITESKLIYKNSDTPSLFITPDKAICETCKNEIETADNRRHQYYFNACVNCGPRFSLMQKIPFERENTMHNDYGMCKNCQEEYHDENETRRYLSQLNSCENCNFTSKIVGKNIAETKRQLDFLVSKLKEGQISAVKSLSGFLLMADFRNSETLKALRNRKKRPYKPFAIMAKDFDWIEEHFFVNPFEKKELLSDANPIVILQPKEKFNKNCNLELLSGFSKKVGVLMANSGYSYYLTKKNDDAILATSANTSAFPLEYENKSASENLKNLVDVIWDYERKINFPQDDSVLSFSPVFQHKIFHRKSKGFSPSVFNISTKKNQTILALGADLKATFSIYKDQKILTSPYLGRINSLENLQRFELFLHRCIQLFNIKIDIILCDAHPNYLVNGISTQFENTEIIGINHYEAHFSSVLGENQLWGKDILGFMLDGLGFCGPKKMGGGEVIFYQNQKWLWKDCFPKFKYISHDKMSLTPKLSYFSLMQTEVSGKFLSKFNPIELKNLSQIYPNQIETRSIGRVFDALAFVLGYQPEMQSYEGECASFLDPIFTKGLENYGIEFEEFYEGLDMDWKNIFIQIENDIYKQVDFSEIAIKFINTLTKKIITFTQQMKVDKIAISGGVFQNGILLDYLSFQCKKNNISLFRNNNYSPNDENISFGQIQFYLNQKQRM